MEEKEAMNDFEREKGTETKVKKRERIKRTLAMDKEDQRNRNEKWDKKENLKLLTKD